MTFNHYLLWFEDGTSMQVSEVSDSDYGCCADGYVSIFGYADDGFYEYNPSIGCFELVSKEI